jgi:hypothetical protein
MHVVVEVYGENFLKDWGKVSETRKPIIAAVSGFAVTISHFNPLKRCLTFV